MNKLMIVSNSNALREDYVPSSLVDAISGYKSDIKLDSDTYYAFLKMKDDAKKSGYLIDIMSGYRSFDYQRRIYNSIVYEKGLSYALTRVAKAGLSEHQSGLAIDFCVYQNNKCYIESDITYMDETKWVHKNMHKYGFILRYPLEKEDITGFDYEPWHIRYVGEDAKRIYKNSLTLEEYVKLRE